MFAFTPGVAALGINIQSIPTPELWIGPKVAGGGGGPIPGILDDPDADYILDENGQRIISDPQ